MVKRIQEAQQNPNLRPTLQSLFRAHELILTENEQKEQANQTLSRQGTPRAEHTPKQELIGKLILHNNVLVALQGNKEDH